MTNELDTQARALHDSVTELVKRYQFRDRQEICCFGISVSQCHTLSTLSQHGAQPMGELAEAMRLKVSSMTRVVDQLVDKKLVRRDPDPKDRRVCTIALTAKGKNLFEKIEGELLEMEKQVLSQVAPKDRANLIQALGALTEAVDKWRACHLEEGCC
ncbi:MAG: MarR family transcriptional regulator [Candidatus Latescibacteria bacterium]|nr:MarR family transcriptional regulator [Candidatus Latescibacterota bacterium]